MSVTIMEVLQGAKINLVENKNSFLAVSLGRQQLTNVVELLEKGYSLDDDFDTVMGDAETVEDVPNKK